MYHQIPDVSGYVGVTCLIMIRPLIKPLKKLREPCNYGHQSVGGR